MSESETQIQINQINSQINRIEVNKRVYSVLRSVVESSTKPIYEWNKPIAIGNGRVKFVKYKVLPNNVEVKAWEVIVEPIVIEREGLRLTGVVIKVYDGVGNEVADLTIRDEFTITEIDVKEPNKYSIAIDNTIIGAKSIHEYEYYVIEPRSPVPYALPISLAAVVNKLMFYLSVVRNTNAAEA